ncbi:nicotinate-nucleotide--dimethylbenzimidazole phosphoribosyltransferase [Phaeobacter inhibens]|uniref:nicotinate-nucleotide--dimethylbenzimidazole phosphoribosyltransferase n=1 Tax=Phaeobacter inhibens TaxID=221822 RepID=UPI0021A795CD|nr:nicotinate-nucleotide--dimethylbenzimidazole phosphoribosyltransferase [Phaeobacter inhibens]UWR53738.1 nicotinate-nucleotide--dimethylbenzimidazole phosphoribosyltransferase [Phaeobacter inhibens]UWR65352.1 nicotinate-nucleotide--dimethylbenzimidazole phosphoribosyltransferase [Phaeobacter inhibens]UWR69280.1 nicotinate-nucleotide--dimethylbenzimidazole phosphoribosyltransferase [Phaeobacter inhibens]UWR73253.1 nicotinate-nucleotide--dimethylbenzimidazole phosphoribosyltransferase [Phaeobac
MLSPLFSLDHFRAQLAQAPGVDEQAETAAAERNSQLTKPPGSLGRLEDLAIWYGSWRGTERPVIRAPQVIVFAGNHGIVQQGVSAFPSEVTAQMVANFKHGGAAINQLAKLAGARLDVHSLDLETPTKDFTKDAAMDSAELLSALQTGWKSVDPSADLLVVGEMGIGNTTPAAALACALFGGGAGDWTGRGTGVDDTGLANKTRVVAEGVALHGPAITDGVEALRRLGGREIAAMAGAMTAARMMKIPVILDGFICCAAAACLMRTHPAALDHVVAGHQSAESAHAALLTHLGKPPFLSLDLRLGEGSGAALAIQVLRAAVACHSGMATFEEAGVSGS